MFGEGNPAGSRVDSGVLMAFARLRWGWTIELPLVLLYPPFSPPR